MCERNKTTSLSAPERGSSLIGVAILTLAMGFLITGGIYLLQNYEVIKSDQSSVKTSRDIETAIQNFANREGRYPCPALLDAPIDDAAFGIEDCANSFSAIGRAGASVVVGTVPVRTINAPDKMMLDGYGNRYIYAVTESMTNPGTDVHRDEGAITITNENGHSVSDIPGFITYALIDSGNDTRGTYNADGVRLDNCEAGTDAGENCDFIADHPNGNATFISSSKKSYGVGSDTFTHNVAFKANSAPYKWFTNAWSGCAGICFTGTQTRTVECRDHRNNVVADSNCSHTPQPPTSRNCGLPPCEWDSGAWSACNGVCFSGTQTRTVVCLDHLKNITADSNCPGTRPIDNRSCSLPNCRWRTNAWGSCR